MSARRFGLILLCMLIIAGCGNSGGGDATTPPAGDTSMPALTISATPDPVPVGEAVTVTLTASEEVTGLSSSTVQIANGLATAFHQTGPTHYEMTVTAAATAGMLTITIPANTISDAARNVLATSTEKSITIAPAPDAPWAILQGMDATGPWADLAVTGATAAATQRFRWMPAGSFIMGTPVGEPGHNAVLAETQHTVTLSKGFWMAESECTQRMWKAVMAATPSRFTATEADGLDLPVEQVSYEDIQGANGFLSSLATLAPAFPGTLPTEAQWEYACRAGTTTALYNGPIVVLGDANAPVLESIAWYGGNGGAYQGETTPAHLYNTTGWYTDRQYPDVMLGSHHVKLKAANAWGLYDMIGNVWEWCADWRQDDLGTVAVTDPTGPASGTARILRGGSAMDNPRYCRAGFRLGRPPTASFDRGFRLCAPGQPRTVPSPRADL